jgi:hypothetical protein
MNNEPVAWMMKSNDPDYVSDYIMFKTPERKDKISHQAIPLYTHPAKELDEQFKKGFEAGKEEGWKAHKFHHPAKTLTDEEILIEAKYQPNLGYYLACEYDVLDFARAILRKAQEK